MNRYPDIVRVLLCCTGTGRVNRGIETFFREAFDGLQGTRGLRLRLLKGAGPENPDERVVSSLARTSRVAKVVGCITRRNGYVVEQWTSLFSVAAQIREFSPHVVFYSDANLGFLLFRFRKWIDVPYKLLFSNGGPVDPPFVRTDFVHQVAAPYLREAMDAGEPLEKHFLVPYGIRLVAAPSILSREERNSLRARLGLPTGRSVVLSVGWVQAAHKRMDYVIKEIARLPQPRPYLQLLGSMDEHSREILALGERLLGKANFGARSVAYEQVFDFYRAADCFALGSLREGFGRVYIEALMHGLPVIAHDCPVTRYVLGSKGVLCDLTKSGTLATALLQELGKETDYCSRRRRWAEVRNRFSWPMLADSYREMFQICATTQDTMDPLIRRMA